MLMNKYHGISWWDKDTDEGTESQDIIDYWLEEKYCDSGHHLFDEVVTMDEHYLHCDACGLMVFIDHIDVSCVD